MSSSMYGGVDQEAQPLVHGLSPPRKGNDGAGRTYWVGVGAAILLAMALLLNVGQRIFFSASPENHTPIVPQQELMYRPMCQVYPSPYKLVTAIQTSMKDPSHQWAPLSCFAATSNTDDDDDQVSYLAPDAVLSVNLNQQAFVGRPPILGFGGAFTEASARNLQTLPKPGQDAVIDLLFGKDGLGYALGRIHMNSCDFSVQSYSFDETDGDFKLQDFDMQVTHDVQSGMIDFAKRAVSKLRQDWSTNNDDEDGNLRLYASPWSPPAWMKNPTWQDDDNATHATLMTFSTQPSCLREGTGSQSRYAAAWALYFSKYLQAYANQGVPFWAVTVQNEPEFPAPWEACAYSPRVEAQFVAHHLGPQLRQDHPDVKILIFDHNKDHIMNWTETLLDRENPAAQYINGTAYHWYAGGMDRLLDGALGTVNLHRLQSLLVNQNLQQEHIVLGSESCHCPSTGYAGGDINVYWSRAERYVHTILADLAAGSNGWVEWNLILDGIGGPNHLGNLCDATLLALPHRAVGADPSMARLPEFEVHFPMGNVSIGDGRTREELNALGFPAKYLDKGVVVQPSYFYMGHVSRFVRPGSRAVTALVTQGNDKNGRIFRPIGSVVTGGGQNDLAREGIEVTLWPCEGSTRQQFKWKNEVFGGNPLVVHGHDWLGHPTTSCIASVEDQDVLGLRLVDCADKAVGRFDVVPMIEDPLHRVRFVLKNGKGRRKEHCLVVRKLANSGGAHGPRGGAQVTLGGCTNTTSLWSFDDTLGEISSFEFVGKDDVTGEFKTNETVCMTTGWPFLQMGAFQAATQVKKTVVVLNEANDPANYALINNGKLILTGNIPARSVQTFQLEENESE